MVENQVRSSFDPGWSTLFPLFSLLNSTCICFIFVSRLIKIVANLLPSFKKKQVRSGCMPGFSSGISTSVSPWFVYLFDSVSVAKLAKSPCLHPSYIVPCSTLALMTWGTDELGNWVGWAWDPTTGIFRARGKVTSGMWDGIARVGAIASEFGRWRATLVCFLSRPKIQG